MSQVVKYSSRRCWRPGQEMLETRSGREEMLETRTGDVGDQEMLETRLGDVGDQVRA